MERARTAALNHFRRLQRSSPGHSETEAVAGFFSRKNVVVDADVLGLTGGGCPPGLPVRGPRRFLNFPGAESFPCGKLLRRQVVAKPREEFAAHPFDGITSAVGLLSLCGTGSEVHDFAEQVLRRPPPFFHHDDDGALLFFREWKAGIGEDELDLVFQLGERILPRGGGALLDQKEKDDQQFHRRQTSMNL